MKIEDEVLRKYSGNEKEITIPNNVTKIGEEAFKGCTFLTSVAIPNGVTEIEEYAFYGCTSLILVIIPNSVTKIGRGAFQSCDSLTSMTIPNSVTEIGYNVFADCLSLTSITIPNSVTEIALFAFYNCTSLTSVTIPNSVTEIGVGAFAGCTSLKAIYYNGTKEEWNSIYSRSLPSGCKVINPETKEILNLTESIKNSENKKMRFKIINENSDYYKQRYDSYVRRILQEMNYFLEPYEFKVELVSEDDYEIDDDKAGMFLATEQTDAKIFPVVLNSKLLKTSDPEEIELTLAHEVGHGIFTYLSDVYDVSDLDEEEVVEDFAQNYFYGSVDASELMGILNNLGGQTDSDEV